MQTRVVWLLIRLFRHQCAGSIVCNCWSYSRAPFGAHWALVTFQDRVQSGHMLLCVAAELISHTQGRACVVYTPHKQRQMSFTATSVRTRVASRFYKSLRLGGILCFQKQHSVRHHLRTYTFRLLPSTLNKLTSTLQNSECFI